jgi:hypothetical protein
MIEKSKLFLFSFLKFRNGKLQYAWPELIIQSYATLEMKKHFESD